MTIAVKHIMAYSLLVLGYLMVRKYITVTSDSDAPSTSSRQYAGEDTATAIIALAENMEYVYSHAVHIPETDKEAIEEIRMWVSEAEKNLNSLVKEYIQETNHDVDLRGDDVLDVQDRRGRRVRVHLRSMTITESPDAISYKKQLMDLQNTKWEEETRGKIERRKELMEG